MNFDYTPKMKDWIRRVGDFMDRNVYPAEKTYNDQMAEARAKGNPWIVVPVVEELSRRQIAEAEQARTRVSESAIEHAVRIQTQCVQVGFADEAPQARRVDKVSA